MMYFMTFNIFTHRSTTEYCPPNTAEKDKIIFKKEIPHSAPLSPLLSPPRKTAREQPQLSNVDTSSDFEKYPSKSIVANPLYPPSTSSNQTTPTSVTTSINSYK